MVLGLGVGAKAFLHVAVMDLGESFGPIFLDVGEGGGKWFRICCFLVCVMSRVWCFCCCYIGLSEMAF